MVGCWLVVEGGGAIERGKMHGRMARGGASMEDGCGCTVTDVWTWACIGNI